MRRASGALIRPARSSDRGSDAAELREPPIEQRVEGLAEVPKCRVDRIEHADNGPAGIAMRSAQRLGHNLVDDPEFQQIVGISRKRRPPLRRARRRPIDGRGPSGEATE